MRAHLLLLAFLFTSCAGPRIPQRYSAPSVAPVRTKIASAQSHVGRAIAIARQAKAAPNLELKNQFIDALTVELVHAQTALKQGESKAGELQLKNDSLAQDANHEATERSKAQAHDAATTRRYHTVKLYFCTAAAAVALLLAFQFRWLFALLGPFGMIAGLAGLPAVVFGALWLWL